MNADLSNLMVMIPETDAHGTAGSGEDRCHGVEMDHHICNLLQYQLLLHDGLETSGNRTYCSDLKRETHSHQTEVSVCFCQDSNTREHQEHQAHLQRPQRWNGII